MARAEKSASTSNPTRPARKRPTAASPADEPVDSATHRARRRRHRNVDHRAGRPDQRRPEQPDGGRPRPDAARGLRPPREDLPLRPRAHPRARRARPRLRRPRLLRELRRRCPTLTAADAVLRAGQAHRGVRPVLDGRRQQGLGRPRPRRPRLRREVLHRGGQLGPRRQQHPGVLHPGRDEVPGPGPLGQAGAGPRLPAGAVRARQLLGLRLADARSRRTC